MKRQTSIAAAIVATLLPVAQGVAEPWLAAGNVGLRHDLELLADAGIVRAPVTTWPVSWGEILRDVRAVPASAGRPLYLDAALARVRKVALREASTGHTGVEARVAGSAEPLALRRFGDVPREEGEAAVAVGYMGDRFAWRLEAGAAVNPADDHALRPDGSYFGVAIGNWMVHAGYIDRWWGPGWEGSLIYGSNARPIPSVTLERNFSDAVNHPWLAWLGQWRFVTTMGVLEGDRDDAPHARYFGARLTWKPHSRIEVGLSRSAQWCGEGRPCGVDTFWDLLTGNDNDQPLEEQPGNQMAGFDARWSLPWAPLAIYGQMIGEDEAGLLPSQYLGLFGAEVSGGFGDRSWRAHVEYADTACSFYDSVPNFGCAYNNVIYTDGYQYYDRSVGHAIDGDSEQYAMGMLVVNPDGSNWELAAQSVDVNRATANPVHSVEPAAAKIRSIDLYHRRSLWGGDLSLALGYERRERPGPVEDSDQIRGYAQWTREFQ